MVRRTILLLIAVWAAGSWAPADEPEFVVQEIPVYKDPLDWTNAVKRPHYELLKASKQHGWYFALFRTPAGDLALCNYNFADKSATEAWGSLVVRDMQGRDVQDFESKVDLALGRRFKVVKPNLTMTVALQDGCVYPLVKPTPSKVRVTYRSRADNSVPAKTLFDEVIELNEPSAIKQKGDARSK